MSIKRCRGLRAALAFGASMLLAACASPGHGPGMAGEAMDHEQMMKGPMAHAHFAPADTGAAGRVMFHALDGSRLYVHARLTGLPPGKPVGLALRDGGCAADGPAAHDHAAHAAASEPAPGLPTLEADPQGGVDVKRVVDGASLAGIVGRSLLLQAGTGGPTMACAMVAAGHHGAH